MKVNSSMSEHYFRHIISDTFIGVIQFSKIYNLIIKRNMGIIGAGRLNELIEIWFLDVQTTEYGDTHEEYKFASNARAYVDHAGGSLSVENLELFNNY